MQLRNKPLNVTRNRINGCSIVNLSPFANQIDFSRELILVFG